MEEGLALDSVALLEFVVGIENEFGILLDDESLTRDHFESLSALSNLVKDKLQGKSPT